MWANRMMEAMHAWQKCCGDDELDLPFQAFVMFCVIAEACDESGTIEQQKVGETFDAYRSAVSRLVGYLALRRRANKPQLDLIDQRKPDLRVTPRADLSVTVLSLTPKGKRLWKAISAIK